MTNNVVTQIKEHIYIGVVCSFEESKQLLHPSYWDEIRPGHKMSIDDKVLIRYDEKTMLIRVNGSRNFIELV